MGLTMGNIHVHGKDMSPVVLRDVIKKFVKPKGMVYAKSKKDALVTIRLVCMPSSPWVTICAEAYNACDTDIIVETMRKIADALDTTCVSVNVYDSDVAVLRLVNRAGEDMVISGHDDPEGAMANGGGDPAHWAPLLNTGFDAQDLPALWHGKYVFAEEMIATFAPMIGIPQEMAALDCLALEHGGSPGAAQVFDLYFKAKQASGSPLVYEGLPRFVVHQSYFVSGMPNIIKCYNHGGISKGLEIIIRGEAIEQGWVTFSSLQLESYYDPAHPDTPCTGMDRLVFPCEPKPCKLTDGRSALLCSFPDIAIPPGVNTEFPGLSAIKISDMLYDRSMILRCCATLHQGDEAKFHIIPTACQYQRWTG